MVMMMMMMMTIVITAVITNGRRRYLSNRAADELPHEGHRATVVVLGAISWVRLEELLPDDHIRCARVAGIAGRGRWLHHDGVGGGEGG